MNDSTRRKDGYLSEYGQAVTLFKQGKISDAKTRFEKLNAMDSEHIPVLHNLAACYLQLQLYEEAESVLEALIERIPNHAETYFNAGKVACLNGKYDEAIGYLEYALKLGYNRTEGTFARAIAYHGNKHIPEALNDFNWLLEESPDNVTFLHYRLSCLVSLQHLSLALQDIEKLELLRADSNELASIKELCVANCQTEQESVLNVTIPITQL